MSTLQQAIALELRFDKRKRPKKLKCKPGFEQIGAVCKPKRSGSDLPSPEDDSSGRKTNPQKLAQSISKALSQMKVGSSSNVKSKSAAPYENISFDRDPGQGKNLSALGISVAAVAATLGAVSLQVTHDLKRSEVDYDSIRKPPGGVPDAETLAKYDTFKPGDLIRKNFRAPGFPGARSHYAVYIGRNPDTGEHELIEVGENVDEKTTKDKRAIIRKRTLTEDAKPEDTEYEVVPPEEMNLQRGTRKFSREEIVRRAERMLSSTFTYKGFSSNCEAFARGIVEGKAYSQQGMKISPLTDFISGEFTNIVNHFRVSGVSTKSPAKDEEGGIPLPFVGEGAKFQGWSDYARDTNRMTAQQMVALLEREEQQEIRRDLIQRNREALAAAKKRKDSADAVLNDDGMSLEESTHELFQLALLPEDREDPKELEILGLLSPEEFSARVEAITKTAPAISDNIRIELYKIYLMFLFGILNKEMQRLSGKQEKSDSIKNRCDRIKVSRPKKLRCKPRFVQVGAVCQPEEPEFDTGISPETNRHVVEALKIPTHKSGTTESVPPPGSFSFRQAIVMAVGGAVVIGSAAGGFMLAQAVSDLSSGNNYFQANDRLSQINNISAGFNDVGYDWAIAMQVANQKQSENPVADADRITQSKFDLSKGKSLNYQETFSQSYWHDAVAAGAFEQHGIPRDAAKNWQDFDPGQTYSEFRRNFEERKLGAKASAGKTESGRDWNSVLGVNSNASPQEIQRAYRRLVKENHPDLAQDPDEKLRRQQRMIEINQAFAASEQLKGRARRDTNLYTKVYYSLLRQSSMKTRSDAKRKLRCKPGFVQVGAACKPKSQLGKSSQPSNFQKSIEQGIRSVQSTAQKVGRSRLVRSSISGAQEAIGGIDGAKAAAAVVSGGLAAAQAGAIASGVVSAGSAVVKGAELAGDVRRLVEKNKKKPESKVKQEQQVKPATTRPAAASPKKSKASSKSSKLDPVSENISERVKKNLEQQKAKSGEVRKKVREQKKFEKELAESAERHLSKPSTKSASENISERVKKNLEQQKAKSGEVRKKVREQKKFEKELARSAERHFNPDLARGLSRQQKKRKDSLMNAIELNLSLLNT